MKYSILILCFLSTIFGFSQSLKVKPYTFVSKAGDTVKAEIGSLKVKENRSKKTGDSIQLSFIRFKSTNPNPSSPIVYLSGGPGGSGTVSAKGSRFPLFMKLREIADVIAFDQRGTGLSNRLKKCPYNANFEINKPLKKPIYIERTLDNINKCLNFWKEESIDLPAYNTSENARDLDDLRKAIGAEKISLWGISYGSHLAFEYIRQFENRINKIVLASLEGPDETIKLPKDTEDFVFKIAEKAKEKYPGLKKQIKAVHNRIKQNPVVATYKNRRGILDTVGISNFELQSAISTFYLKNPQDSKKLPKLYNDMYNGDFSKIAADVMVMKRYVLNSVSAMPFAMDMQSSISGERNSLIKRQIDTSVLGSTINFLLYEWMNNLDFPKLPANFRELKVNHVKALLLSGNMDGRTYLASGIEIAKHFKNGKHIIVENAGHDLFMSSDETSAIIFTFLNDGKVKQHRIKAQPIIFD